MLVKGKLNFQVLYRKAEGGLQTMAGSISFEEPVNVSGLEEKDYLGVSWDLEDLTAGMINSRKISVKAIVTLVVRVEALYDAEAAVDVVETGTGSQNTGGWGSGRDDGGWNPGRDSGWGAGRDNGGWNQERDDSGWNSGRDDNGWNGGGSDDSGVWDGGARNWETGAGLKSREGSAAGDGDKDVNDRVADMEILRRQADVAVIAVRRKDTYRIKEDISLSGSKPSIEQILWNEIRLRGVTTKPLDGRVHIEGEVMIFAIYTGEGESAPIQWLEESIPFAGEVDLPEAVEGMVPSISVRLVHRELEAKPW